MKTKVQELLRFWNQFWFESENLLGLACMRVVLCGTMFCLYFVRSFNMNYYSDATSWILKDQALGVMQELLRPLFLWAFWPDSWNPLMHGILVVSLFLLTFGIGGRFLMAIAWMLNASFIQRNYAVNFGADIIANLFLFHLMFTQSCARLNILNGWRKKIPTANSDWGSSVMFRMLQVQLLVIYAYTGWEKLRGQSWWDGTALWSILANPQMTNFDLSFVRTIPWIVPILSFSTILFEIYFPVFVLFKKTRPYALLAGVALHMGIGLFMGLEAFALVMLSVYFLFLSPAFLQSTVVDSFQKQVLRVLK